MRRASILYGCEWILWGQSSNITHCKSPAFPLAALSALVGVVDVAFVVGADRSAGATGVSAADCATTSESIMSFVTVTDEFSDAVDVDNSIGTSASLDAATLNGVVLATGDGNFGGATIAAAAAGVVGTG